MWSLLLIAVLAGALVEVVLIIQVGQAIGAPWTIALLVILSALGAWIVKREGLRAWASLREAVTAGHLPGTELANAALVVVGGALLLTPGFATDAVGFLLVLPPTRAVARRALLWYAGRRATQAMSRHTGQVHVVRGEVIDGD